MSIPLLIAIVVSFTAQSVVPPQVSYHEKEAVGFVWKLSRHRSGAEIKSLEIPDAGIPNRFIVINGQARADFVLESLFSDHRSYSVVSIGRNWHTRAGLASVRPGLDLLAKARTKSGNLAIVVASLNPLPVRGANADPEAESTLEVSILAWNPAKRIWHPRAVKVVLTSDHVSNPKKALLTTLRESGYSSVGLIDELLTDVS